MGADFHILGIEATPRRSLKATANAATVPAPRSPATLPTETKGKPRPDPADVTRRELHWLRLAMAANARGEVATVVVSKRQMNKLGKAIAGRLAPRQPREMLAEKKAAKEAKLAAEVAEATAQRWGWFEAASRVERDAGGRIKAVAVRLSPKALEELADHLAAVLVEKSRVRTKNGRPVRNNRSIAKALVDRIRWEFPAGEPGPGTQEPPQRPTTVADFMQRKKGAE